MDHPPTNLRKGDGVPVTLKNTPSPFVPLPERLPGQRDGRDGVFHIYIHTHAHAYMGLGYPVTPVTRARDPLPERLPA
jgi:hypothetical protein